MKLAAIALAGLAFAGLAGSALAAGQVSDVDYLRANRCKGLAAGLGGDTANVSAFIKAQGATRLDYVIDKGQEEYSRAKRQTADANLTDRLRTELAISCAPYMGPAATVARKQ